MAKPIAPEELERRRLNVVDILARNPSTTLNHIRKAWGYSEVWLKTLDVTYGKPVRQNITLHKQTVHKSKTIC